MPLIAVVGLGFVTCAMPYVGVGLITLGLAFTGCTYGAGFMVNYNDVAGPYSGLAFGTANTVGTVPGFVAPYLVSVITANQKQEEWRIVFFITAVVYFVGGLGYILLGSGELEEWAVKKQTRNDAEEMVPLKK